MKIGVVIPSYKDDVTKLENLLKSIEHQTVLPDYVVISCSSMKDKVFPTLSNYSFPIHIKVWDERKNAAQNRNIGSEFLMNTMDLISYFDADDIMHPQRIELILKAFKSPENPDIVLHSFWDGKDVDKQFELISDPNIQYNSLKRAPSGCTYIPNNYSAKIHHAQATIKTKIFETVKFKEASEYERREDAVFCGDVVDLPNVHSAYIDAPLSKYFISGSWNST